MCDVCSSKEIEVSACNGDEAFLEVRVQQSVVEFILNHTEQIFNPGADPPRPLKEGLFKCFYHSILTRLHVLHLDLHLFTWQRGFLFCFVLM